MINNSKYGILTKTQIYELWSKKYLFVIGRITALLCALAGDASRAALAIGGVERKVNVLLGVRAHEEGGNIYEALANTDVLLLDENAGVVNGLGKTLLEHLGLKAALEEPLGGKLQHEVELVLLLGEKTVPDHATKERLALKKPLGVLLVESEETTGSLTDVGEHVLHAPDLALAAESVLAAELELLVEALLLEGATGGLERLGRIAAGRALGHLYVFVSFDDGGLRQQ